MFEISIEELMKRYNADSLKEAIECHKLSGYRHIFTFDGYASFEEDEIDGDY